MAQWYVLRGDKPVGPFSPEELKTQAVSGQLTRRDMLRKGESGQWVAASHVRGLFVAASDVPPRPAASSANPPSDSRWRERGDRGVEAFRDDEQAVWWYSAGGFMGAACGPLTASRMRELAQAGKIKRDTDVRHDQQTHWDSAENWPWIFDDSLEPAYVEKTGSSAWVVGDTQGFDRIVVTTCDLHRDYRIIGPVYFPISNRGVFASEFKRFSSQCEPAPPTRPQHVPATASRGDRTGDSGELASQANVFELAFSLAVQELKRRAEALGADAVVGLRTELELDPNDFQYFFLQAYGTAVRFTRRSGG